MLGYLVEIYGPYAPLVEFTSTSLRSISCFAMLGDAIRNLAIEPIAGPLGIISC